MKEHIITLKYLTLKYFTLSATIFTLFTLLFIHTTQNTAQATSIQAVTVEEALQGSELVIEGRVINSESRKPDNSRMIYTYVTIEIMDVIKGNYSGRTIELPFMGGQFGDQVMEVGEMEYPQIGEHGVYFIESLERNQVHSLYGWSQGHFLIREDTDGVERVTTKKNSPVTGMDNTGYQQQVRQARQQSFSEGEAKGLQLEKAAPISRAMTVREFKSELSTMSGRSKGGE